ncbi:MAG TPA: FecR domain-containing protein [Steroidobacteraceae bacterium]|jgi:transmembrane sensor|nr:FecR domain-containing protein [Steroidobacteraceae bacterium]
MSRIVRFETQTQIDNEAAVWTWRADSIELSAAERSELEAWLREDIRHRRAFEELNRTWRALDSLSERARDDERIASVARPERRRFLSTLKPRRYWEAAAAAVLVLGLAAVILTARRPGLQVMSTAVGQQRHVTLADGSELSLNTNTVLAVKLTSQRRDIYLRRGEAHFDVVHDASRPFFVHAGDAVIRDVGTQFEVRLESDRDIDVLVDQGEVEVRGLAATARPTTPGSAAGGNDDWVRALSAGEQLLIAGPHLAITSVSPRQIADDLAWREGAVVFQGEPLSQALAEVGRYTRAHVVLAGPQLASLKISGRFRTDDVRGFFRALQAALPVRVSQPQPGVFYIEPR